MRRRLSGFEMGVVVAVAVVIAVAVALEGDDTGTGRASAARTRPLPALLPALTRADVDRISGRVERLRGLRFERPVRPLFVSRERALRIYRSASEKEYTPYERRVDEEALKLLGLLAPSEGLDQALGAIEGEQILGFYDDHSKRLVVIRDPGRSRALLEITLAHELVHALEDQRFGLGVHDDLNDDATLAETAVAEGTATAVMTDYAGRYLDAGDLLSSVGAGGETKLPAYVEKVLLFPYLEGEQFVAVLRAAGGWGAVNRVLRVRRPSTAEQVLHPDRFVAGERPVTVAAPPLRRTLGPEWRRVSEQGVGELDLRALFEIDGGEPDARAAAGWGGGRFDLWRLTGSGDCPTPCVRRDLGVLRLAWDTEFDREEGERALARGVRGGLDGRRIARGAGLALWSSRGGAVGMLGAGRETVVVLAPDPALAARVLIAASR
jgi:hypothetical protein